MRIRSRGLIRAATCSLADTKNSMILSTSWIAAVRFDPLIRASSFCSGPNGETMSSPGLAMVASRNALAVKQCRTYRMKWIIKPESKLSGSE